MLVYVRIKVFYRQNEDGDHAVKCFRGVFFHKFTFLWFVFDLIVFTAAAPIIYTLVKNKIVGLISILAVVTLYGFNIGIPENIFFRSDSIIFYLIGAYIGCHWFEDFKTKAIPRKLAVICILLSAAIALVYKILDVPNAHFGYNNIEKVLYLFSLLAFCGVFWHSFDAFPSKYYHFYQKQSFAIYVMHMDISGVVTKLIYLALPKMDGFALVNYFVGAVITIVFITSIASLLEKRAAGLKAVLFGR